MSNTENSNRAEQTALTISTPVDKDQGPVKAEKPKPATESLVMGIPLKYVALFALVIQTTMAVILTRHSKIMRDPDMPPYYSTTLVIMAEITKLILSQALVFFVDSGANQKVYATTMHEQCFASPLDTCKVAVPALLYTIQNNLIYVALSNLEATTFQVGYQLKVVTTAILSVILLNRKLSVKMWTAVVMLTIGIILTQMEGGKKGDTASKDQNFVLGLSSVIACGFCSAFAGVYFEKILKGTNPSLWMRNSQLAFFATICGFFTMWTTDGALSPSQFFQGYDSLVWFIIMVQAAGGLIVAMVVKFADNIMKGFAAAISIVVCGVCSMTLFGFMPSAFFMLGSGIVITATFLYAM